MIAIAKNDSVTIALSSGMFATVDADDFDLVCNYRWCPTPFRKNRTRYARANVNGVKTTMHRLVMGVTSTELWVDHKDGNGLNNCRGNLRVCNPSQNQFNRRKSIGLSSRYKGVTWDRANERWRAQIMRDGRARYLGRFTAEVDAARAYDESAVELFGEFARLNFPLVTVDGNTVDFQFSKPKRRK